MLPEEDVVERLAQLKGRIDIDIYPPEASDLE